MQACAVVHYSDPRIEYPNLLAASYVLLWHPQLYNHLIFRDTILFHALHSWLPVPQTGLQLFTQEGAKA